jgi:hypothetical protein
VKNPKAYKPWDFSLANKLLCLCAAVLIGDMHTSHYSEKNTVEPGSQILTKKIGVLRTIIVNDR